jgi:hypothetical protein
MDWTIRRKSRNGDPQRLYAEYPEFRERSKVMKLSSDWVVGFTDGEGCFYVGFLKHPEMSVGYQVLPEFRVVQHKRDIQVLYALKSFFKGGVVRQNHEERYELRIRKLESLKEVVAFFEKHPLKTKKKVDFERFAYIIRLMSEGRHLTKEGLMRIIDVSLKMNRENKVIAQKILEELKNSG